MWWYLLLQYINSYSKYSGAHLVNTIEQKTQKSQHQINE